MDKKRSISAFVKRAINPPTQINNASLYAGSSMYFYCQYCGYLSEVLPESYITPPTHVCHLCEKIVANGWMPDAQKAFFCVKPCHRPNNKAAKAWQKP